MPKSPKREKKAKVKDIWLQLLTRQRDMEIAAQENADKELDAAIAEAEKEPEPEPEEKSNTEKGGDDDGGAEKGADGVETKEGDEEGGEGEPEEEKELTEEEKAAAEAKAAEEAKQAEADKRAKELMALKPQEHVLVVCGAKGGGKSSFVLGFLNPAKADGNIKPTTALEYSYGRKARGTVKDVVHVWELGGGLKLKDMLTVPITAANIRDVAFCITIDLSEPGAALSALQQWIGLIRTQTAALIKEFLGTKELNKKAVDRLQKRAKLRVLKAADRHLIEPTTIPIVVVCTKMDVFHEQATNKRKALFNALRYHAHVNGASIVAVSRKDKTQGNFLRGILNHYAFGNPFKSSQILDSGKAIVVPAGADSLEAIGLPGGCETVDDFVQMSPEKRAAAWTRTAEEYFELVAVQADDDETKEGENGDDDSYDDDEAAGSSGSKKDLDLQLAPEPVVDAMVRQKEDELEKYRKEAERKRRVNASDKKKRSKS